jgi:serine protease Do
MQPSRRNCLCALFLLVCVCMPAVRLRADTLTITSTPPGANVEIDGVLVGITPCKIKYPGGYFHKTKTVWGTRLEHPMIARIYKDGYTTEEMKLTDGPLEWVALNGSNHGHYWVLKTDSVQVTLQPASSAFDGHAR